MKLLTVEARVADLEAAVVRWRRIALVGCTMGLLVMALLYLWLDARLERMQKARVLTAEAVEAHVFVIRDADGTERAAFRLGSDHEPEITMRGIKQSMFLDAAVWNDLANRSQSRP
jgi:hypothetical protein